MSKKLNTEIFIERSKLIHGDKYDYSETIYTKSSDKLKIKCSEHGVFKQRASNHLRGLGCHICSSKCMSGRFKSWSERVVEFNEIHGNKYTYGDAVDVGAFDFITITCKKHGDFKQRVHDHSRGKGCRACGNASNARKKLYVEVCNEKHNGESNFYLLKMTDINGIDFYKLGITIQGLSGRFNKSEMPYSYKVLRFIKLNAGVAFDLEKHLKEILSKYRYSPELHFSGSRYECFSHIPNDVYGVIDSLVSLENE